MTEQWTFISYLDVVLHRTKTVNSFGYANIGGIMKKLREEGGLMVYFSIKTFLLNMNNNNFWAVWIESCFRLSRKERNYYNYVWCKINHLKMRRWLYHVLGWRKITWGRMRKKLASEKDIGFWLWSLIKKFVVSREQLLKFKYFPFFSWKN